MVKLIKETKNISTASSQQHVYYHNDEGRKVMHRENNLPAYRSMLTHAFYKDGSFHRLNGPSYERSWYINGRIIFTISAYFKWLDEVGIDINNIGPAEELMIAIQWDEDGVF